MEETSVASGLNVRGAPPITTTSRTRHTPWKGEFWSCATDVNPMPGASANVRAEHEAAAIERVLMSLPFSFRLESTMGDKPAAAR
jgi:hypothetical protein